MSIAVFLLASCGESSERSFSRDGISFICPKGWTITDEDSLDGQGYYLSMEKDGLDASGLLTVSWVRNDIEPEEYLEIYKVMMSNNIIYKNAGVTFGDKFEGSFNGVNSTAIRFNVSFLSVAHEGIIHIFTGGGKTISILRQEASEDADENQPGFASMEKSFIVE